MATAKDAKRLKMFIFPELANPSSCHYLNVVIVNLIPNTNLHLSDNIPLIHAFDKLGTSFPHSTRNKNIFVNPSLSIL